MLLSPPQLAAPALVCKVRDFAFVPSKLPVKIIFYVLIKATFMPMLQNVQ